MFLHQLRPCGGSACASAGVVASLSVTLFAPVRAAGLSRDGLRTPPCWLRGSPVFPSGMAWFPEPLFCSDGGFMACEVGPGRRSRGASSPPCRGEAPVNCGVSSPAPGKAPSPLPPEGLSPAWGAPHAPTGPLQTLEGLLQSPCQEPPNSAGLSGDTCTWRRLWSLRKL